jgi:hypothetical protein
VNEMDLLSRMRADVPEDPEALARARQRLLHRAADPQAGRARPAMVAGRRTWRWAAVGGVAAAGLAVALVIGTTPGVPSSLPVVAVQGSPPNAVTSDGHDILLVAAERVEGTPPASGRYLINQTRYGTVYEVGPADDRYQVVDWQRADTWIAQDPDAQSWYISQALGAEPLTATDRAAWQRDGEPATWADATTVDGADPEGRSISTTGRPPFGNPIGTGAQSFALGDRNVTQQELDALPTDPARLRSTLLGYFAGGGGDLPSDPDRWLFTVGSSIVVDLPVSPAVRAAAYRMLDGLHGVRDLGSVQDADGRTGQAVAVVDDTRNGTFESRLVIDPASGRPLAQETWAVGPDGASQLVGYRLVLSTGYTDDSPPPVNDYQ